MVGYIDAPMPYISGVPKHIWQRLRVDRGRDLAWLPSDVCVFDVDKRQFKTEETSRSSLPDLPSAYVEVVYNVLLNLLNESMNSLSHQVLG